MFKISVLTELQYCVCLLLDSYALFKQCLLSDSIFSKYENIQRPARYISK